MAQEANTQAEPAIIMARSDHERLLDVAESFSERNPSVADTLFQELDRANVVADEQLPPDVVRMGSTLRFTTSGGEDRTVTLVYPDEADISAGKVSVLTPIGAALIGLSAGQSIDWVTRDGGRRRLTVESVNNDDARASAADRVESA